jgi:hypothetical protein
MRTFATLIVLVVLFGSMAHSQTSAATALGLKPEQIPAECKAVDGYFPIDIQILVVPFSARWPDTEPTSADACDGTKLRANHA